MIIIIYLNISRNMALPKLYDNPEEYFNDCIRFFKDYQYLFKHPNTNVLVDNVLDEINIKNLHQIDVHNDGILEEGGDEFLQKFFERLSKLKPTYNDSRPDENIKGLSKSRLTLKKQHEIVYLATEIKNVCKESGCEVVVDFGSGLGYLDQQIFETSELSVLGLEANENFYATAKTRQKKYHEKSMERVKYIRHTITEKSDVNIKEFLAGKFPNTKEFCITGLHACADLTIDAIDIFLRTETAKAFVLMPCCYHKLAENGGVFKNMPLSKCLKGILDHTGGYEFINVPFLRLATQPPNHPEKLEDLIFNLLSRAVLQLYAHKHGCKLERNKRKAVKMKVMKNSFENYIQDACTNGFTLLNNQPYSEEGRENFDIEKISSIWSQLSDLTFKKAGIYIILQNCLQSVFENFILYDRIVYLNENDVENCWIKRIFDDKISPRCLALLAYK